MRNRSDPRVYSKERTTISHYPHSLLYKYNIYQYKPSPLQYEFDSFPIISTPQNKTTIPQTYSSLPIIQYLSFCSAFPSRLNYLNYQCPPPKALLQKLFIQQAMLNPSATQAAPQEQVYGFLCQRTNVFYAFESFEAYQEFLLWLERENSLTDQTGMQPEENPSLPLPNEAQQLVDFQMATDEIMSVFEDLAFKERPTQIQLEEVDF